METEFEPARRTSLSAGLAALLLAGCHKAVHSVEATPPIPPQVMLPPTPAETKLCAATASLGEDLLSVLQSRSPLSTIAISPLSVMSVLAMLAQGARGATLADLSGGLRFAESGLALKEAADAYAALKARLASSPYAAIVLANSLWVDRRLGLKSSYARAQGDKFGARVESLDLSAPEVPTIINRSVADATRGRITDLVGDLPPASRLVAVSALYFKGAWSTPFDVKQTRVEPFTRADGHAVDAPLMRQDGEFGYLETERLQSVSLPYRDGRFELVLMLMKKGMSHRSSDWRDGLSETREFAQGEVVFPRMKLTWRADLKDALSQIGLAAALGGSADYGDIADKPIAVSQINQAVVLIVDEQGAEAAAATDIGAVDADARPATPPKPFSFRADRPFYLSLRDINTGLPFFMAYVADPTAT